MHDRSASEVVADWKGRLLAGDWNSMGEVVDLEGYTEVCLGLTGWTTGYATAAENFQKNMVDPWSDMITEERDTVEGSNAVASRFHVVATHTGEFLGIAPTGRRIEWDAVSIVQVRDGKIIGQWVQPDLYAIHQQLTASDHCVAPSSPPKTVADDS
jgi:predicted ester cyclase